MVRAVQNNNNRIKDKEFLIKNFITKIGFGDLQFLPTGIYNHKSEIKKIESEIAELTARKLNLETNLAKFNERQIKLSSQCKLYFFI